MERLGAVIQREGAIRVPATVETSPMALRDWEAAVGSRIAARARPLKLERGVLHVRAASATWAQELSLLGDAIAAQLRSRGVQVTSLRFRVGKVDPVERPPWRDEPRTEPPEVPLPAEVQQELSRVVDPELRKVIARAAAKNLGWQAAAAKGRPGETPGRPQEAGPAKAESRPTLKKGPAEAESRPALKTQPEPAATSAPRGARAPRSAASGSAPPDRTTRTSGGGRRGTP